MTNSDRKIKEKQVDTLMTNINNYFEPKVTESVVDRFGGDIRNMSNWSFEEMMDDIVSKANDID